MGMRVGTLPCSLTLPPSTVGEEPRALLANEVCVLEELRMQALARHSEALQKACTAWADAFCRDSLAEDENEVDEEEVAAESDSDADAEDKNSRRPCSVIGCTSRRNLEYKYCANHLERKRKNFLHREIAKRMFTRKQELYEDFIQVTKRIGAINELLVAPIRRTTTDSHDPHALWRRRPGSMSFEWLETILDRLYFPYRKAGEEPGAYPEVEWRGRGGHPWCECEDQRKSEIPSLEAGNIRIRCKICGKVKIGNQTNIRGKERADNCFLCKEALTLDSMTPGRRIECYCCERCCHHPDEEW